MHLIPVGDGGFRPGVNQGQAGSALSQVGSAPPKRRASRNARTSGAWRPGTVLHDRQPIALPPSLPPGQYAIVLGWYGTTDPARLPAFEADRPIGDAVRLATIEIVTP